MHKKLLRSLFVCLLAMTAAISCSKGDPAPPPVEISGVTIRNKPASIFENEQARLATEVTPSDITEKYTLEFSSSKPDVASVDNQGNIKGLKAGQTVITLSVKEKPSVKDEFTLTVKGDYKAPANTEFKTVGYFPSYRNLTAASIPDASLKRLDVACYAFANINNDLLPVVEKPEALRAFAARCKALGVKILICFAGKRDLYVKMSSDKVSRDKFVAAIIKIVEDYDLDGIDNDWEWPNATNGGHTGNLAMMREFSSYCHAPGVNKLLTMAITPGIYKGGYTDGIVDDLHQYVDWYNVMVYGWAAGEGEINKYPTVWSKLEMSYDYWINTRQMPTSKFLTGIGCYGRPTGISDDGRTLTYVNIIKQGDALGRDYSQVNEAEVEATKYPGQKFTIYYDGQPLVAAKTTWSIDKNLGGMMFWELGQDIHDDRSLVKASYDAKKAAGK